MFYVIKNTDIYQDVAVTPYEKDTEHEENQKNIKF
jgi:hypothetical protein